MIGAGVAEDRGLARFAADVREHLARTPRQLPSRYLYDDLGSALFEAICRLPWYRITRAEARLLTESAEDLFARLGPVATLVELGSGSGEKLRALLDAASVPVSGLEVHLIDLSASALEAADRILEPLAAVRVIRHRAAYEAGITAAARAFRPSGPALVLFLGSNVGNFDPPAAVELLRHVRGELRPGDALLLGADLVKTERELRLAYDDPLGVTAAFNRNLLVRLNRELGADFEVERFAHRAIWNERASRVEMHLVAETDQLVRIAAADVELRVRAGESIRTESSHKYRPEDIDDLLDAGGFRTAERWIDHRDGFALTLARTA